MDAFLDDLELFTVVSGLRPMAKKEGPLADALAAAPERLAAAGLDWVRAANGVLFAGRDRAALARAAGLETTEVTSRDPATRRAAIVELGRLLGYPECCVRAFADLPVQDDVHVCAALLAPEPPQALPWELQFLPPLDSLVLHYPCRLDCASSLGLARRTAAALETAAPGSVEARRRSLARVVVAAGRFEFLVAGEARLDDGVVAYRGLRSARDFHPGVPVDAGFAAFAAALPAEGVLEVRDGAIRGADGRTWKGPSGARVLDYRG
jgi:hypothetical protein